MRCSPTCRLYPASRREGARLRLRRRQVAEHAAGAGWETYGIEPSTTVAFLRHRQLEAAPQDGTFDLVILHHVLEHVPKPLEVLRSWRRRSATGASCSSACRGSTRFRGTAISGTASTAAITCSASPNPAFAAFSRAPDSSSPRASTHRSWTRLHQGQPLRLRLLAQRTATPPPLPPSPLRAGGSLDAYARRDSLARSVAAPAARRLRGARMDWNLTDRPKRCIWFALAPSCSSPSLSSTSRLSGRRCTSGGAAACGEERIALEQRYELLGGER